MDFKTARPHVDELVGHCRIIELIGSGGYSDVYKAFHEQLEVLRAVKILKPGFSTECKNRLESEAKISANLRHPNILEIYGLNYWNDIPYIEMEYVDGISLSELLSKHEKLPVPFAISVVHYVCEALNYAANQQISLYGKLYEGVIHRDIKPANILIGSNGLVKLADFGIARPSEEGIHTTEAKLIGTMAYLSPEQFNKDILDSRCDIYSLGTVLYELVTGKKTFPQRELHQLIGVKFKGDYNHKCIPGPISRPLKNALSANRDKRHDRASELDTELLTTLSTYTTSTPQEIIRSFFDDETPLKRSGKPRRKQIHLFWAIPVLLLSSYLLLEEHSSFFNRFQFSFGPKIPPATSSTDSLSENINAESSKTVTSSPAAPKSAKITRSTLPEIPSVKIDDNESLSDSYFQKGLTHYRKKGYSEALTHFEKAFEENTLFPSDSLVLFLVHSYVEQKNVFKARSILNRHRINDPFMAFLHARCHLLQNRLAEADSTLSLISRKSSRFKSDFTFDLLFTRATVRKSLYQLDPDAEKLSSAVRSWQEFVQYCNKNPGPACSEAISKTDFSSF